MSLFPKQLEPALTDMPLGPNSNIYFVDPANGSDSNPGTSRQNPMKTVLAAYNKCVSGQNDIVAYIAGTSGETLTAAFTWSKSYTHLVGLVAPVRTAQRARIFAPATGTQPVLWTISGTGCIFKNIYWFNGTADAAALGLVLVSGGRNYFENCHFAGPGHASNAINGGYALGFSGGDGEHLMKNCTIGVSTIGAGTGWRNVALISGYPPRLIFEDCNFTINASHKDAMIVEGTDGAWGIDYHLYKNCCFFNTGAVALDTAFEIAAANVATQYIFLLNCWRNSMIDDFEDNARACVWVGGSPDMGTASSMGDMIVATAT